MRPLAWARLQTAEDGHERTRTPGRPARGLPRGADARRTWCRCGPACARCCRRRSRSRKTRATHWSYEALRPLLLKAGELTPIEKAERRVLVLANPGHGLEKMQASAAMYLGMQLLLPGEWAPVAPPHAERGAHGGRRRRRLDHGRRREVPDAARRPDPHAHRPVARAWPRRRRAGGLARRARPAAGVLHGGQLPRQRPAPERRCRRAASAPTHAAAWCPRRCSSARASAYPMLRYPWVEARAALRIAGRRPARRCQPCRSPTSTPRPAPTRENILGFYALMLRPGPDAARCRCAARRWCST